MLDHVQTKHEIQTMLEAAGIRPRKRFGQHFLIDGNLMRRLAEAAELAPDDTVLEVGAGTGGLTDLLVPRASHLVCVEVDPALHGILEDRFREAIECGKLTLLHADALETKHRLADALGRALRAFGAAGRVVLVSNLPYGIATPLIMNLLVDYAQVCRFVFTVQAEVGERFTAEPCSKEYGPLSILSQTLCRLDALGRVASQAFWPRPEVDSIMLRVDVLDELPDVLRPQDAVHRFATLLHRVFEHRRKTLRQALSYAVGDSERDRLCVSVDGSRRPEMLAIGEWLDIFRMIDAAGDAAS